MDTITTLLAMAMTMLTRQPLNSKHAMDWHEGQACNEANITKKYAIIIIKEADEGIF